MGELGWGDATFLRQRTTATAGGDLNGGTGGPRCKSPASNGGGIGISRSGVGTGDVGGGSVQGRHERDCASDILDKRECQTFRLRPGCEGRLYGSECSVASRNQAESVVRCLARLAELHDHTSGMPGIGCHNRVFQVCQRNVPNALALQTWTDVETDRDRAITGEENGRMVHGTESTRQILTELIGERGKRSRDRRTRSRGPESNLICAIHGGGDSC